MKLLLKSKKGDIGKDIFAAISAILILMIMFLIAYFLGITTLNQMATQFSGNENAIYAINKFRLAYGLLDKIIVLIAGTFVAAIAFLNYKIAARPVFIVLNFIMAAFYLGISYTFNFITVEIFNLDTLSTIKSAFPATYLIGINFHWLALVMFVAGIIALYGKKEKGQELI